MVTRTQLTLLLAWNWLLLGALMGLQVIYDREPPFSNAEVFPAGVLRVGIDPSFPPFAQHTQDGFEGLDIDLGEALAAEINLPVQFIPLGYDGLYDALKTDSIDVLLAGIRIDYRHSEDVIYSMPFLNGGLVLLSPKSAPLTSQNELPEHRVAYGYGTTADHYLWIAERELAKFQPVPYQDEETALRALKQELVSAAIVDGIEGRLFLRMHDSWVQAVFLTEDHLAIAMRRDRPLIYQAINNALGNLWLDGRLSEILARWL